MSNQVMSKHLSICLETSDTTCKLNLTFDTVKDIWIQYGNWKLKTNKFMPFVEQYSALKGSINLKVL